MIKNIIIATEVRNNFFKFVDMVAENDIHVYIEKSGDVKVRLAPLNKKDFEDIVGLKFFKLS